MRRMARGARYRVINKKKTIKKGILYFPLLLSSLYIFCLSIFQPTNNDIKIPPTGISIFEVRASNKSKNPSPKMVNSFHIPNENEAMIPRTITPTDEPIAALAREICSSSFMKATITSKSEMVEVKEAKASRMKKELTRSHYLAFVKKYEAGL
jgi:hypothetical protein